jgi:hypothetical protein
MKSELRYYAIREKDEEIANRYWRLYYRAINVEHEFREIVLETEVSRLIDIIIAEGLADKLLLDHETPGDTADEPQKPDTHSMLTDDDIPPRQKGCWD